MLAEIDALRLALMLRLGLALTLLDGVGLADALIDGLTEALALEIISRTANETIARSSLVPFVSPTDRDPCPGVFSNAPTKHCEPTSSVLVTVELAPAVGGV
jgi:hypothetical protein